MVPQRTMQPCIARVNGQLDRSLQPADTPPPQSAALGLHPVGMLLLNSRPAEGKRLSWPGWLLYKYVYLEYWTKYNNNVSFLHKRIKILKRNKSLCHNLRISLPLGIYWKQFVVCWFESYLCWTLCPGFVVKSGGWWSFSVKSAIDSITFYWKALTCAPILGRLWRFINGLLNHTVAYLHFRISDTIEPYT